MTAKKRFAVYCDDSKNTVIQANKLGGEFMQSMKQYICKIVDTSTDKVLYQKAKNETNNEQLTNN